MDTVEKVPDHLRDEALINLSGVDIYDASALEKGVVDKINKTIQEKEVNEIKNKIGQFQNEIRTLKNLIDSNEKERLLLSKKNYSEVTLLKFKTLISQREKHHKKLKICENKLIREQFNLQVKTHKAKQDQSATNTDSTKEVNFEQVLPSYDSKLVATAKTLKERQDLIKHGLATPFSFDSGKSTKPSSSIKLDDAFGSFLDSSKKSKRKLEKSQKKQIKTPILKRKSSSPDAEEVSNKLIRLSNEDENYQPSSSSSEVESEDDTSSPAVSHKFKFGRQHVVVDDANPKSFKKRLDNYKRQLLQEQVDGELPPDDKVFDGGLKVPGRIWKRLYKYQQTGVKWLWELHSQQTGGILGDEMGLGKTIQVIAFLAALSKSKIRDRDSSYSYDGLGPVLIVCPATVMHQWVREFHTWAPFLRIAILHSSGSHKGSQRDLVSNIALSRGILVTSYARVRIAIDTLLGRGWHYVILDEGHKIRNPEAGITHAVKLFPTPHRLILSGSPIQNHLRELWSLFDFVYPGKLGILPVFMEQFSVPIVQGGYSNASEIEVQTAYKCACMLRSTISPYLLRRMKQDVQSHIKLPEKSDQVLFCSLTDHQVDVYQNYLSSDSVNSILHGRLKVFVGLIQLRKICNHPDLSTGGPKVLVHEPTPQYGDERRYGFWKRSGKMIVVESLLRIWRKQNKKVLLFTQSKQMLNILEDFVKSRSYTYLTMHGGTPISSRQPLIKKFNEDPDIFVFILTTRVGGLGVNLIGASRVIIYDPDWNPSTDAQAQERAWRIGQDKQVTIYRLLTSGTIEEKIYHRQIFKHFVSNRILKDPRQRRFFKANDMHELFVLGHQHQDPSNKKKTETAAIFAGTGSEVKIKPKLLHSSKSTSSTPRKSYDDKNKDDLESPSRIDASKTFVDMATNTKRPSSDCPGNPSDLRPQLLNTDTCQSGEKSVTSLSQTSSDKFGVVDVASEADGNSATDKLVSRESESPLSSSDKLEQKSDKLRASFFQVLKKFKQSKEEKVPKSSKSRRKQNVDGEVVENLVKKRQFKGGINDSGNDRAKSDDYVLSKLFSKGVHSALEHTTIMESGVADYALVEAEANRVAKEAVRNVRLSRQRYKYPNQKQLKKKPRFGKLPQKQVESSPSTSDGGSSASAPSFRKLGTASSDLLMQIRKRTHIETPEDDNKDDDNMDSLDSSLCLDSLGEEGKLLQSLVDFLATQHKAQATTRTIMNEFESEVPTVQAPRFRAMLHKACEQKKSESGESYWILNDEFR